MKMNGMKKVGAWLLTVAVMMSVLSVPVFAATESTIFADGNAASVTYVEKLGLYVAVGVKNTGLYLSADGYNWVRHRLGYGITYQDFAYNEEQGNGIGILGNVYRAKVFGQYLDGAPDAHMIVRQTEATNAATAKDGTYFTYLQLRPEIIYDSYTKKYYCGGLESSTAGSTNAPANYVDMGLYCSDGVVRTTGNRNYGNGDVGYTSYMEWTKVDMGTAEPYGNITGTIDGGMIPYKKISSDGNGRIVASLGAADIRAKLFGSKTNVPDIRKFVVLIDNRVDLTDGDTTNDAPKYQTWLPSDSGNPTATMDKNGNVIVSGIKNMSAQLPNMVYQAFDTLINQTIMQSVGTYAVRWYQAAGYKVGYNEDVTGKTYWASVSSNFNTENEETAGKIMASPVYHYAALDDKVLAFPTQGLATVASGYENDIKALTYYSGSTSLKLNYNTVVNNDTALGALFGNGGTPVTIADVAVGPNGQIVILKQGKGLGITVLETKDNDIIDGDAWAIDAASTTDMTDRSTYLQSVTKATDGIGIIRSIALDKNEAAPGSVLQITSSNQNAADGLASEDAVSYAAVGEYNSDVLTLDANTGTLSVAANAPNGQYTITVKVAAKDYPAMYNVNTLTVNVGELKLVAGGDTTYISSATETAVNFVAGADNTITVSGIKTVDTLHEGAAMIVALYTKDGELVATDVKTQTIAQGASFTPETVTLTVPAGKDLTGAYIKVYTWDGFDSLKPL